MKRIPIRPEFLPAFVHSFPELESSVTSLVQLLTRLDLVIAKAFAEDIFTDELNPRQRWVVGRFEFPQGALQHPACGIVLA